MMMESNAKLREFEAQVKHLGLDNNLIKNMAELFKKWFIIEFIYNILSNLSIYTIELNLLLIIS